MNGGSDIVLVQGLKVRCVIGVLPHERRREQELEFDLELHCDFAAAAASDNVDQALDYTAAAALVEQCARAGRYGLLEALGWALRDALTATFPQITALQITIRKAAAISNAQWCGVRVRYP